MWKVETTRICIHTPLSQQHTSGRERGEEEETTLASRGPCASCCTSATVTRTMLLRAGSLGHKRRAHHTGCPGRAPNARGSLPHAELLHPGRRAASPRSFLAPRPFGSSAAPHLEGAVWDRPVQTRPRGPSTVPAPHDLSTAHQSPLGRAGPSSASGWPRAWISKYQENGGRRPASPGAPCSCHPTQGLCAPAPRRCPAPSTFSTSGQEAGPKCRSELIRFCPPRRTFAHFLQHPELTVNSRSRCTRALGLACTETEMEVTRRGTEKNLPSRRKLMVTWLGTVATERK